MSIIFGDQVPVIPLVEVEGKIGTELFWQKTELSENVGETDGVIIEFKVKLVAHWPALGVKI